MDDRKFIYVSVVEYVGCMVVLDFDVENINIRGKDIYVCFEVGEYSYFVSVRVDGFNGDGFLCWVRGSCVCVGKFIVSCDNVDDVCIIESFDYGVYDVRFWIIKWYVYYCFFVLVFVLMYIFCLSVVGSFFVWISDSFG